MRAPTCRTPGGSTTTARSRLRTSATSGPRPRSTRRSPSGSTAPFAPCRRGRSSCPGTPLTRLVWLLLVVGSAACLTRTARRARRAGFAGLALALLWGLDEAVALGKTEAWSSGQLVAFAAAAGLVAASALIAREVWPGHPGRAVATAAFVAAYPVDPPLRRALPSRDRRRRSSAPSLSCS